MTEDQLLKYRIESLVDGQDRLHRQQQEMHTRVDAKLDKLTEAMTYLAQHEERLSAHYEAQQRLGHRIDGCDDRITGLDDRLRVVETQKIANNLQAAKVRMSDPALLTQVGLAAGGMVLGAVIMKGLGV
ncbi:MAG TPA: hypothetical protein ENO14_05680 [Chromatiales bacterium]|nr:hypothetical protein [Chromatiales bacterium]